MNLSPFKLKTNFAMNLPQISLISQFVFSRFANVTWPELSHYSQPHLNLESYELFHICLCIICQQNLLHSKKSNMTASHVSFGIAHCKKLFKSTANGLISDQSNILNTIKMQVKSYQNTIAFSVDPYISKITFALCALAYASPSYQTFLFHLSFPY